jgi:hypothetical protein
VSQAWIGVVGALGGVVVTGVIGLVTAGVNHRWQEETRRRERLDRLGESRATLRRDSYTRFLVAADQLTDYFLTQRQDHDADDVWEIVERLRNHRLEGTEQFSEYFAAQFQATLLAGERVSQPLEDFIGWINEQCGIAAGKADPLGSGAFDGFGETRRSLVKVMRTEQDEDLGAS